MDDWEKAGKVAKECLKYGKSLVKEGASILEICEKVEKKILVNGCVAAFPVQISLNSVAAHDTGNVDDPRVLKDEVVKLDVGVCYNGSIGDNAATVDLDGSYGNLLESCSKALANAVKVVKDGVELREIGNEIENTIMSYGFKPVKNLSGHGLGLNIIHDQPSVPNYDNKDREKLFSGKVIAIEPFATDGAGLVANGKASETFRLVREGAVRNYRDVLDFIKKFEGRPFAKRWLVEEFNKLKVSLALNEFSKRGLLQNYDLLVEKNKGMVAQFEHSVRVGGGVLTNG